MATKIHLNIDILFEEDLARGFTTYFYDYFSQSLNQPAGVAQPTLYDTICIYLLLRSTDIGVDPPGRWVTSAELFAHRRLSFFFFYVNMWIRERYPGIPGIGNRLSDCVGVVNLHNCVSDPAGVSTIKNK